MKIISKNFIEQEINNIGFDTSYIAAGVSKHKFLSLKIYDLKPFEANIIKQTALSTNTDAAVHKHSVDCKIEKTDCLLSGSITELCTIAKKLQKQPPNLKKIGLELLKQIELTKVCPCSPKIMGILNLTPDSFSDGGKFLDFNSALKQAKLMIESGADIIDIGAESTRPNADRVDVNIEIQRLLPVIEALKNAYPTTLISVDTRNSITANSAIESGADIINDVSGLRFDPDMAKVAANSNKKIIITHSRLTPKNMDEACNYLNLIDEIYFELKKQCDFAVESGVRSENIIVDVGFGFAKNFEQNIELLRRIEEFKSLGFELAAGVSRKRFLQRLAGVNSPTKADFISAQAAGYLAAKGVKYIRVHNVQQTKEALRLASIFL